MELNGCKKYFMVFDFALYQYMTSTRIKAPLPINLTIVVVVMLTLEENTKVIEYSQIKFASLLYKGF